MASFAMLLAMSVGAVASVGAGPAAADAEAGRPVQVLATGPGAGLDARFHALPRDVPFVVADSGGPVMVLPR